MLFRRIEDWDDAYANGANVPRGERWPFAWEGPAQAFRAAHAAAGRARLGLAYGEGPRRRFDLFLPEGAPRGLAVIVHGGYWAALDASFVSHLAAGAVARGLAAAVPSYRLAPEVRLGAIVQDVAAAVEAAAAEVAGPIVLAGHSAGGHLVARMACLNAPLAPETAARIVHVLSLSGVHDLRPLLFTQMNGTLRLDAAQAAAESPALLAPRPGTRLTAWVGAAERAEFLRQSRLLADVWVGLGAATALVVEPDRHHFDVVDGLADPGHPLAAALVAPALPWNTLA